MKDFYKMQIEKLTKEGKTLPEIVEAIVQADRIVQTLKNTGYQYEDMLPVIELIKEKTTKS